MKKIDHSQAQSIHLRVLVNLHCSWLHLCCLPSDTPFVMPELVMVLLNSLFWMLQPPPKESECCVKTNLPNIFTMILNHSELRVVINLFLINNSTCRYFNITQ